MEPNAVVPKAMLRDYWLPHFRNAVVEGNGEGLQGGPRRGLFRRHRNEPCRASLLVQQGP
jgi:hypothetical protein